MININFRKTLSFLLLVCLLTGLVFNNVTQKLAYAAPGDLDPSFGIDGKVITPIGIGSDTARAVTIQADGKLVVAGGLRAAGDIDFVLARYNADGTFDATFGMGGMVTTDFGKDDYIYSMAMTGTQIIVAGRTLDSYGANFALARYNADGKLDKTFGIDGRITTDFGYYDYGGILAFSGSKFIVGGLAYDGYNDHDIILARYNADGSLDTSFSADGKIVANMEGDDRLTTLVLSDTQILVGGYSYNGGLSTPWLVRYNADGSLDSSFGSGGKVTPAFDVTAIVVSGTQIVLAGNSSNGNDSDFALARYHGDGELDTTFGTGGIVTTNFGFDEGCKTMTVSDTQIVVAGFTDSGDQVGLALAHYHVDGSLDTSFSDDGIETANFGPYSGQAIAISGAYIAAAGYTYATNADFAVARYSSDGIPDTGFGDNGVAIAELLMGKSRGYAMATLTDGSVIVGGQAKHYANGIYSDFTLARYHPNGDLDETFGDGGIVFTDFMASPYFHGNAYIQALALSGTKIVAVGSNGGVGDSGGDFALARYNPDGSLDITFGITGSLTTDFGSSEIGSAIVISGTQVIVAGTTSQDSLGHFRHFALASYDTDGNLDESFGDDGKVITDFGEYSYAQAIALYGTKIIVAGYVEDGDNSDFALACYNADGTLDATFGTGGIVTSDFSSIDQGYAMALSADKIIVAGTANGDFALVRYNLDGSLDTAFGNDGIVTTDFGFNDQGNAISLSGTQVVVAGQTGHDFALALYNADGSLDTSFGAGGKIITDFGYDDYAHAVDVNDSQVTVAGESMKNFALARYVLTDGGTPLAATDDNFIVAKNSLQNTLSVLENDTVGEGGVLQISAVGNPDHGGTLINGGTVLTYTPAVDFTGTEVFSYTVNDGQGGEDTANVIMTVTETGINIPPVAGDDNFGIVMNSLNNALNVLGNDTDGDDDILYISAVGSSDNGGTLINAGTMITYTPNTDFTSTEVFTYTVSDTHGGEDTASVTITVFSASWIINLPLITR